MKKWIAPQFFLTYISMTISLPALFLLVCGGYVAARAQTPPKTQSKATASAPAASAPLALKTTIPLPDAKGRMDHLGVDLKGNRLFLAEIGNGGVEVIDLAGGKRLHMLTGFGEPQGVYFDSGTNRLFVASGDDGTVKIFDGTTYAPVATAKFSSDADNLRFDPRSTLVIVGYGGEKFVGGKAVESRGGRGIGDGALAFVDANGKTGPEISVDAHPESFQLEKTGTRVFVNVPDRHEVQVADLAKGTVIAHWPVSCTDNFPMSLDEAHHRLFIGCRIPAKMQVLDTDTGKTVASVDIPGTTDDLFFDGARGRIYVLGGEGYVDVYAQKDADHYERTVRVPAPVGSRTGLFVPDLNELFVSVSQSAKQPAELLVYEAK
jgi:DNA-binding beta-propeller fold protein YncE